MGRLLERPLLEAYLDRLGVDAARPSAVALRALHRRHVETVPYETMWIQSGEKWGVDPHESVRRIALQGRGGYCYHLNGALAEVLRALGYSVGTHIGSVRATGLPEAALASNHVVLTVRDLPSDDNPDGLWYVDVGLGDALHDPLPLRIGTYQQGPFQLTLERTSGESPQWRLLHDPAGGFETMSWDDGEVTMDVFAARHEWLSTSPESPFVRVAMAERRYADGVDVIRGLVRTRMDAGAREDRIYTDREEWFAVLSDEFGLSLEATSAAASDLLWAAVQAGHRDWLAQTTDPSR